MKNTKLLFLKALVTPVLIVNIAIAQETKKADSAKFAIGIHVGPSGVTWVGDMTNSKNSLRLSYMAGVSFQYLLTQKITLNTELNYENKGNDNNNEAFDRINYIALPVTAKFKFNSSKSYSFYINAGGYVAYNTGSWTTVISGNPPIKETVTTELQKFDYGLVTGVGIMKKFNKKLNFSIELRNSLGLAEIFKHTYYVLPPPFQSGTEKAVNESLALIFGLSYTLGK